MRVGTKQNSPGRAWTYRRGLGGFSAFAIALAIGVFGGWLSIGAPPVLAKGGGGE